MNRDKAASVTRAAARRSTGTLDAGILSLAKPTIIDFIRRKGVLTYDLTNNPISCSLLRCFAGRNSVRS